MTTTSGHTTPSPATRTGARPTIRVAVRVAPALLAVCLGAGIVTGTATASEGPAVLDPPANSPACAELVDASSSVRTARAALEHAENADSSAGTKAVQAGREVAAAQAALVGHHPGEPGYAGLRERYEEAKDAAASAATAKQHADTDLRDARRGLDQMRARAADQLCSPADGSGGVTTGPGHGHGGHGGHDGGGADGHDGDAGTPSGSDGSTATVSGSEVTEVPEGAAQTGSA